MGRLRPGLGYSNVGYPQASDEGEAAGVRSYVVLAPTIANDLRKWMKSTSKHLPYETNSKRGSLQGVKQLSRKPADGDP